MNKDTVVPKLVWQPCGKKKCRFYHEAACEVVIKTRQPKNAMWLKFDTAEHIGYWHVGVEKYAMHPCLSCSHYDPTKFDNYQEVP